MFMYAVKKPAAAALGEDGTAVFCEGPGLLFASARGETPDAGITTAIFNDVEKGNIHDGDRWFPGAGSIAEVVFDMPAPLGEKLAGRLEDPAFLIDYFRGKIASLGEECDVITGTNIHIGLPAQLEMPAPHAETKPSDEMRCPVLEIEPCEIRAPYIVAKEAAAAAKRGALQRLGLPRGLPIHRRRRDRAPRTPDVRRPLGQGVGNRERHARRARPQGGTGRRRVPVPHPAEAVLG